MDGKLCEYSRPYNAKGSGDLRRRPRLKPLRRPPSGTGFVDGLYTVPGVPPEDAQYVEKRFLQLVDHWAAIALNVLLQHSPQTVKLEDRPRVGWARFLYSLIIRTPENLKRMQQKADETAPQIVAQQVLPEIINSRAVIKNLVDMRWTTAKVADARYSLLTSDRPIIMTNGLAHPDAHLAIPLSPDMVFFAYRNNTFHDYLHDLGSDLIVDSVNNKVSEQAIKYVYGIDDRQVRFVENRLGKMVPSTPLDTAPQTTGQLRVELRSLS